MQARALSCMAPGTVYPPLALRHSLSLGFLKPKLFELLLQRLPYNVLISKLLLDALKSVPTGGNRKSLFLNIFEISPWRK